jgi:hypothetical protein
MFLGYRYISHSSKHEPGGTTECGVPPTASDTSQLRNQHGSIVEAVKNVLDLAQSGAVRLIEICLITTGPKFSNFLRFQYCWSVLFAGKTFDLQSKCDAYADLVHQILG